jgi:hypothetical protein
MSTPERGKVPSPTAAMNKKAADCDVAELIARLDYRIDLGSRTETGQSGWYDESFNKDGSAASARPSARHEPLAQARTDCGQLLPLRFRQLGNSLMLRQDEGWRPSIRSLRIRLIPGDGSKR